MTNEEALKLTLKSPVVVNDVNTNTTVPGSVVGLALNKDGSVSITAAYSTVTQSYYDASAVSLPSTVTPVEPSTATDATPSDAVASDSTDATPVDPQTNVIQ